MAPRLLEYPPAYCSACWCADPQGTYVDYQADNDQGYGDDPAHTVPYDNLQLCANCMKTGAALVGMVDGADREQEVAKLKAENDRLKREAKQAQNYADRLEDAFEHRAQPIEIDHRRKPRHIHPAEVS